MRGKIVSKVLTRIHEKFTKEKLLWTKFVSGSLSFKSRNTVLENTRTLVADNLGNLEGKIFSEMIDFYRT